MEVEYPASPRGIQGIKDCCGTQQVLTRNLERKWAANSRTELVFSLLFDELGVPLVLLLPPPAQRYSVRLPGEEVDERVDRVPCYFLLLLGTLRCSILACRTLNAAVLERRQCSVLCKDNAPHCTAENLCCLSSSRELASI